MKYRNKKKLNSLLGGLFSILCIGLLLMLGVNIASNISSDNLYEKVNVSYERGGLTSYGKYVETNSSIYTKDSYDVKYGLRCEVDFDSNINYQIYFYDELDNFMKKSDVFTESQNFDLSEYGNVSKFRIVITPIYDNNLKSDEKEIKWYQVNKYAKQLKVLCLVDSDVFVGEITATNYNNSADGSEIVLVSKDKTAIVNKYWFRILLKKSDTDNKFYIKDVLESGDTLGDGINYDYILACYPSYQDDLNTISIFKKICSLDDVSSYVVNVENMPESAGTNLNIIFKIYSYSE